MSTTRDIPDPAPPGAPPAEADLIREAREHFRRFLSNNGSLDAYHLLPDLADALGRAARERDAARTALRAVVNASLRGDFAVELPRALHSAAVFLANVEKGTIP
jgi:hypothetical protein